MATREERVAGLEARVAVLEKALAGMTAPAREANPLPPRNSNPRWLNEARFDSGCSTARCSTRVKKGERCYYVPRTATEKSQVFCQPCATAMGV